MYAVMNSTTHEIISGPWTKLPGRLEWPGSTSQISPPFVGAMHKDLIVVEVIDTDRAPSPYQTEQSSVSVLVGNVLTITREFAETLAPEPSEIKREAGRRICERWPLEKQINMLARELELVNIRAAAGSLNVAQQAELNGLDEVWDEVKFIRARSNQLEQSLPVNFIEDALWEVV